MSRALFPECRPAARSEAELTVQEWVRAQAARGIDLSEDLTSGPLVIARAARTFDVVFEGRARKTRWKDWLVSLCFFDLVADRPQPD